MNTQTQEALKMAIEALEWAVSNAKIIRDFPKDDVAKYANKTIGVCEDKIQACKEALAQPAQEPVAVITPDNYGEPRLDFIGTFKYKATTAVNPDIPLYTHPAPQPAQEPVAWNEEEFNAIAYAYRTCPAHEIKMVSDRYQELVNYVLSITHPAPSWQGLSNDEITQLKDDWGIDIDHWNDFARAIEQALKEKNT